MRRSLGVIFGFCLIVGNGFALADKPVLAIWDDAIIGDDRDLSVRESLSVIYSNDILSAGDKFTGFVPMAPGYRLLCCVEVVSSESMSLVELLKRYPNDSNFKDRLNSLKGVKFAYKAKFVPESEMNPPMRRLSKGSGEVYYSAPVLAGVTSARSFDDDTFYWNGERVTLRFKKSIGAIESYSISVGKKSRTVSVLAAPH